MPNGFETFEDFVWEYEVDFLGSEGLATKTDIAELHKEWVKMCRDEGKPSRSEAAATAAKTRAANAKKGISQKNLTGSTKQKRWASEIRGSMIGGFSEENQKFLMEEKIHAKFWIEHRNVPSRALSEKLDELWAACQIADAAVHVYAKKHEGKNGVPGIVVTPEFDNLRKAQRSAHSNWYKFLDGEK